MKRRQLRVHLFKSIYFFEFHNKDEFEKQVEAYLKEENVSLEHGAEIKEKALAIASRIEEIDKLLNETSISWKTSRMSKVDLSILRVAVYEMLFDDEVPMRVAINEAVEISKEYGGDESSVFINGILGKISRDKSEA